MAAYSQNFSFLRRYCTFQHIDLRFYHRKKLRRLLLPCYRLLVKFWAFSAICQHADFRVLISHSKHEICSQDFEGHVSSALLVLLKLQLQDQAVKIIFSYRVICIYSERSLAYLNEFQLGLLYLKFQYQKVYLYFHLLTQTT